jgi:DamX protein
MTTTLAGNRNSAVLFVVLIPLVLGLQMAALWVMANASTAKPEVTAQMASSTLLVSEQETITGFDGQGSNMPAAGTAATPTSHAEGVTEAGAGDNLPRMETGLASNVMIPMALESAPASEEVPATAQDTSGEQNPPRGNQETASEEAHSAQPNEEPMDQNSSLQTPEWLQTRTAGHYTMQVERFSDLAALQAFAERVTLPQPQAYYLQTTGRTWYVLVAGDYTDQQVALQAAAELTQQHPAVKPWVRRFRKIQAQLPE